MSVVSDDLDHNLVGDGFTLSRLLGGDNTSPSATSWDTLNESLAGGQPTPPSAQSYAGQPTPPSNQSYENPSSVPSSNYENNEYQTSGSQPNQASNPGYRPWEAEQQQQQQQQQQQPSHYPSHSTVAPVTSAPGPVYYSHGHTHGQPHHYQPHLPSFQSQFHFNENIPPPNTQAPAGPPVPTTGANSRYPSSQSIRTSSAPGAPGSSGSAFQSLEVGFFFIFQSFVDIKLTKFT